MFQGMLLRIGGLLVVTGVAFIFMGWLGAGGPVLLMVGAGCGAVALEAKLNAEPRRVAFDDDLETEPVAPSASSAMASRSRAA